MDNPAADSSLPVAVEYMRHLGLPVGDGTWFIVQPVHFHIARDHIVLTDPRQLAITDAEARALFEAARPLFEEAGKSLVFGNSSTWFVQADDWQQLHTASPDAACGHNIDIWMPQGSAALSWRKLQNEVQMQWHAEAVNHAREARGARPVNSVWLWGGASAIRSATQPMPYTEAFNLPQWMQGLGNLTGRQHAQASAEQVLSAAPASGLVVLDHLMPPALAGDWASWLEQMHLLEQQWFAPLLAALKSTTLSGLTLVANHNTRLNEFIVTRTSLHKFWVKPSLARLLP